MVDVLGIIFFELLEIMFFDVLDGMFFDDVILSVFYSFEDLIVFDVINKQTNNLNSNLMV